VTTPNGYTPIYNGTFNADDRLVAPWFIPGWEVQNKVNIPANQSNLFGPGFPTNLSFVNITGNYFDSNSSGLAGYLTLMMSDNITVADTINSVTTYYRMPARLTGTMNQPTPYAYNQWGSGQLYLRAGFLDIEVFATDQTASGVTITTDSGNPLFYFVIEHFLGGRTYHIQVPTADAPGPVDIESLIVAGTVKPYKYDPVFPMSNMWTPEEPYNEIGPYSGF
jgi:hypothetical protein